MKNIKAPITSNKSFFPKLRQMTNSRIRTEIIKRFSNKDKVTFTSRNVGYLFIVYDTWSKDLNADFTLQDCFLEMLVNYKY